MGKIADALGKAMGGAEPEVEIEMEGDEEEGGDDAAELLATKSILRAVKSGDASKLRSALKDFMSACGY